MIYTTDQITLRKMYFQVWEKYLQQLPLTELDNQILSVLHQHPEYHYIFTNTEKYLHKTFLPELAEVNPFLHFSLHIGLLEQLTTDRPAGIRKLFAKACKKIKDQHEAEHLFMNALVQIMCEVEKYGHTENIEQRYLSLLTAQVKKGEPIYLDEI